MILGLLDMLKLAGFKTAQPMGFAFIGINAQTIWFTGAGQRPICRAILVAYAEPKFKAGDYVQRANQPELAGIVRELRWDGQVESWNYLVQIRLSDSSIRRFRQNPWMVSSQDSREETGRRLPRWVSGSAVKNYLGKKPPFLFSPIKWNTEQQFFEREVGSVFAR